MTTSLSVPLFAFRSSLAPRKCSGLEESEHLALSLHPAATSISFRSDFFEERKNQKPFSLVLCNQRSWFVRCVSEGWNFSRINMTWLLTIETAMKHQGCHSQITREKCASDLSLEMDAPRPPPHVFYSKFGANTKSSSTNTHQHTRLVSSWETLEEVVFSKLFWSNSSQLWFNKGTDDATLSIWILSIEKSCFFLANLRGLDAAFGGVEFESWFDEDSAPVGWLCQIPSMPNGKQPMAQESLDKRRWQDDHEISHDSA